MIEAKDIAVTFNRGTPMETPALRGLDLAIPEGQFVTVIGSNGAGKSTLLNVLTGDAAMTQGRVVIDGQDVTGWAPPRRAAIGRPRVPGSAGRELRRSQHRGEPGAGGRAWHAPRLLAGRRSRPARELSRPAPPAGSRSREPAQ
jgi:energy-coupling factor transporter ATP-binding protein EcfA2